MVGFFDAPFDVEGEAGVDFGRDAAGDDLEDFQAEVDKDFIQGMREAGSGLGFAIADRLFDEVLILGLLAGGIDEGRIGRRIGGADIALISQNRLYRRRRWSFF